VEIAANFGALHLLRASFEISGGANAPPVLFCGHDGGQFRFPTLSDSHFDSFLN